MDIHPSILIVFKYSRQRMCEASCPLIVLHYLILFFFYFTRECVQIDVKSLWIQWKCFNMPKQQVLQLMNVPPVYGERDGKRKNHSCVPLNKNALFSTGSSSLLGFVLGKRGNISDFKIIVWLFFLLREWKSRQSSSGQVLLVFVFIFAIMMRHSLPVMKF